MGSTILCPPTHVQSRIGTSPASPTNQIRVIAHEKTAVVAYITPVLDPSAMHYTMAEGSKPGVIYRRRLQCFRATATAFQSAHYSVAPPKGSILGTMPPSKRGSVVFWGDTQKICNHGTGAQCYGSALPQHCTTEMAPCEMLWQRAALRFGLGAVIAYLLRVPPKYNRAPFAWWHGPQKTPF